VVWFGITKLSNQLFCFDWIFQAIVQFEGKPGASSKCRITNDELQMAKRKSKARMSNDAQCYQRFRHSDFSIPSDVVIRHSDLGMAVHGEPLFAFAYALGP